MFWIIIGIVTKSSKNAFISAICSLLLESLYTYLIHEKILVFFTNTFYSLCLVIILIIPFMVFGYLEFKNKVFGLLIGLTFVFHWNFIGFSENLSVDYYQLVLNQLFQFNWDFLNISIDSTNNSYISVTDVFNFVTFSLFIISIIFFLEIYRIVKNKEDGIFENKDTILNFFNNYSKITGTIIFLSLKSTIWGVIGGFIYMDSHNFFSDKHFDLYTKILSNIAILIFCFWYLRKFMVEFFISYNRQPSWLYWLCFVPFFDYLAWIVLMIKSKKQITVEEKTSLFLEENNNDSLYLFIVFAQIAFVLFELMNDRYNRYSSIGLNLILYLISFVLFYYSTRTLKGNKIVLLIYTCYIILSSVLLYLKINSLNVKITASSFLTILVIYSSLALFQLHEFSYIGSEEVEAIEE